MGKISIINPKNLGEVISEEDFRTVNDLSTIISNRNWSPATFTEPKRLIKNLRSIGLLVLDIDEGCGLDAAKELFKDYVSIIATSRSHQKEKNGIVCDRFRVILFLDGEITNDKDFKATWETAYKRWPFIDKACKDSSRFFYPSPQIISVNESGRLYPTSIASSSSSQSIDHSRRPTPGAKEHGDLWKSTYQFLVEGAPAGKRHTALVSAVGNMREQGYSEPECIDRIQEMINAGGDWTQDHLSEIDLKTIKRMYNRETKYPYRARENENFEKSVIVNAQELLDETFTYLSDKDKVKGDPTGIEGLDALLGGGFRTGELTVLMAQAKTGKNTLYHYLMYKYLQRGMSFGYASRELNPATEVIPNLLSISLRTNAWQANLDPAFRAQAQQVLSQWHLLFAPGYGYFDPQDIEQWFKECKSLGVNHFLFDHFHYALNGEDYDMTTKLIKHLKSLTKSLDIHLSLIVQPRSLRDGEQLSLATLRGGAAIGQALDNLLILERVKGETSISKLSLEVARHKLAKTGHIYLKYNSTDTSFEEVEKETIIENEAPHIPKGVDKRPWPRIQN